MIFIESTTDYVSGMVLQSCSTTSRVQLLQAIGVLALAAALVGIQSCQGPVCGC
jgi:hypothetical protein